MQLNLQAHPFLDVPSCAVGVRDGQTLLAMLKEASGGMELRDELRVTIGGHEVPRHLWDKVKPKAGTGILVTAMPAGEYARSIMMIIVMVAAIWITGGGAAGLVASMGMTATQAGMAVSLIGTMLVNAAFPPPTPPGQHTTDGQWNALTGTGNSMAPGGPIPCVIGESRFFPPHAAIPYSEAVGENSYHYYMFDLGHGTLDVSDIKIGDTAIASFEDVEYEVTTTPTLYTADVAETGVSASLEDGGAWVERTTSAAIDGWSLDLVFPQGLFGVGTSGKDFAMYVYFDIEVRNPSTSGTWVALTSLSNVRLAGIKATGDPAEPYTVYRNSKKPFAVGVSQTGLSGGQVDVRVKRVRSQYGSSDNTNIDTCTWTVLRSITNTNPSETGTNKLVMRIRANDQLSGQLSTLSCLVKQYIPVYDEGTGVWTPTLTSNSAWVALWLLRECPAYDKHVPDSRIDLDSWLDYADFCTTHGLTTKGVLDTRTTAGAHLRDVLAGSLARLNCVTSGKYSVMFDDGTKTVGMPFSELEAGNFNWTRVFVNRPHALKVRFRNPDADWDWDEIIVLDDGYSYNGVDAHGDASSDPEPTVYESLELRQVASATQAWRLGRLQLAQGRFQAAVATFDTDIAGLRTFRGDVVTVQNTVMEWGVGAGFVKSIDGTTVVLTDEVDTDGASSYAMQVRRINSTTGDVIIEVYTCTPHSPRTRTFYLDSTPTGLAVGDVGIIGLVGDDSPPLIITDRKTNDDLHFSFSAVEYTSEVAAYWSDPPATFTSIVEPPEPPDPPDPTIDSDPDGDDSDNAGIPTTTIRILVPERAGYVFMNDFRGLGDAR